jgi:hypothetical protein
MTRLEALRRLAISNPATCKRLDRLASSDSALALIMDDPSALEGHFRAAARLSCEEVESLLAPLVTGEGDAPPSSQSQLMDVRTVAKYA